jgi:hypothetical protein
VRALLGSDHAVPFCFEKAPRRSTHHLVAACGRPVRGTRVAICSTHLPADATSTFRNVHTKLQPGTSKHF